MNIQLKPLPKIPKRKSESSSCLPLPTFKKSRSLQSLQTKSQHPSIESKCNYKLSTQHIHFLMQQQRLKELHNIHQNIPLKEYYQTFNLIFQIIYKTSKMVLTYMYYNRTQELNVDRLQVVNVLMGNIEHKWTLTQIRKLQILSTNLYELSKDEKDFQRRIEYVSRKLCNNLEKRQQIEMAFLNDRLKRFWKGLTDNRQFYERNYFIHDMFSSYSQKLCFLDIQIFINNSLSQQEFKEKIQKYCGKHELDDDLGMSYTFQFLLLQEFSFGRIEEEDEERKVGNESKEGCWVM